METPTTEYSETHPCAARKGLRNRGLTHFSRTLPHSKHREIEDRRMSAKCPKVSFVLLSVSRERGLPGFPWSNSNMHPKFFEVPEHFSCPWGNDGRSGETGSAFPKALVKGHAGRRTFHPKIAVEGKDDFTCRLKRAGRSSAAA